jgi:hypothetical protein
VRSAAAEDGYQVNGRAVIRTPYRG